MTASNFQVCLSNGKIIEISRDLFERFPKDSMLYNLLKEDQVMSTKNNLGQFLLTRDHSEFFEAILKYVETQQLAIVDIFQSAEIAPIAHGFNVAETMQALALTFNYLNLHAPEHLGGFQEDPGSFYLVDIAEKITR